MKENKLIYGYAGLQAAYWMSYGTIFNFTSVYLLDHHFVDSKIGTLLAVSCLLSTIIQPKIASISDNSERFCLRQIMTMLCIFTLIPILCLLIPNLSVGTIAVIYTTLLLLHVAFQPLLSALAMQLIQQDVRVNYASARSMGSFGYSILMFFLGTLTVHFGTNCLPFIALILYGCIIALLQLFPNYKATASGQRSTSSNLDVIKANPKFAALLAGVLFLYVSHSSLNNYMYQILLSIGRQSEDLGHLSSFIALVEIPGMLIYTRLVKTKDCGAILRFSSVMFVAKAVVVALATNLAMIYIGYGLQLISFAFFTPAIVYYASAVIPAKDQVKGQALVTIACTLGNTVGSFVGGYVLELSGVTTMRWVTAGFCFIGMLLFLKNAQNTTDVQQNAVSS